MLSTAVDRTKLIPTVKAETEDFEQPKKFINPSDLDIYYQPPALEVNLVERSPPYFLYDGVSSARKQVSGMFAGVLTFHLRVGEFFTNTEKRLVNAYNDTLADPVGLLKPATISLAALGGAVAAGKGRRPIRRLVYGSVFGATSAAVWNPERARETSTTGYHHSAATLSMLYAKLTEASVTETVIDTHHIKLGSDNVDESDNDEIIMEDFIELYNPHEEPREEDEPEGPVVQTELKIVEEFNNIRETEDKLVENEAKESTVVVADEVGEKNEDLQPHEDFGQSDPEDKDMYSTRS